MMLSWSPLEGALMIAGSRTTAIDTAWRQIPAEQQTPVRRKLTIALVDHVREHHARTGDLAPATEKGDFNAELDGYYCEAIDHESTPAWAIGTYESDDYVNENVRYCRPCAELMTRTGEYAVRVSRATKKGD